MKQLMSTQGLAGVATRHPWLTIMFWVVMIGAAIVSAGNLGNVLGETNGVTGSTESAQAARLIEERLRADAIPMEFVVVEADAGTTRAALDATVAAVVTDLRALDTVASVTSYLDGAPGLLTDDGQIALVRVELAGVMEDATTNAAPVVDVAAAASARTGYRVTTVGDGSVNAEFNRLADETLANGELIGVGVGLVILLVVFGAAVAAGIPLALAIVGIISALGMTALVGRVFELSTFVTNMITMIGLAVGIDYSLFIVQRFREERARGRDRNDAIVTAASTAGRAVLFSGMAVVIALCGMLIMPDPMFKSFGIGAILVVIASVAAAVTLLPAWLRLLGDRVNWLTLPVIGRRADPETTGGLWGLTTRIVTARPVISVLVAGAVLVGAAWFYLGVNLGSNGLSTLPESSNSRHAYEVVTAHFSRGVLVSEIVIDAPDVSAPAIRAGIDRLTALLGTDAMYGGTEYETNAAGDLGLLTVGVKADYSSAEARAALMRLRDDYIPTAFGNTSARVLVTGGAAFVVDGVAETVHYMPIVFSFVLGFSFLLLMLVFRSVVVPLKAVVMNLLSVGAAYGLLVLVFQHGVGADLLGFHQVPVIESWLPLFLFSVLFGLSMDYHVFLLSRIKERYDQTGDNKGAVEFGLRSTGSIITGAALIMVAVFGGFALGDLAMFEQLGFGLAVAVILDATVVRSVLVPASMELLGDLNWYFPSWLEWLPEIHIEGVAQPALVPAPADAVVTDDPAFANAVGELRQYGDAAGGGGGA